MFNWFRIWIWPLWLAIAVALSIPLFRQELDERTGHPPAKLAGLIALLAALGVWVWLRRKWPRAELPVLAIAVLVPALVREPRATVAVVAICAAALALGRCACDWLKLSLRGRAEEAVSSAALGFGACIILLIVLGIGHALYVPVIAALILIAIVLCGRGLKQLVACAIETSNGWSEPDALTGMQTFAALVMIGSMHLVMLTPTIYFDAFATHLAAANYYAIHHTLEPVPFMRYSGFPQGFELLMAAAGLLAGAAGEQMISPVFLLLTLLALYASARELGASRRVAIAGAVFGLAIPCSQWSGAVVKNDLMLAFLAVFALLGVLRYSNTRAPGWIYATAFAAAAAQNVKLSAIIATGLLAILLLRAWWRISGRVREIAIAFAIFVVLSAYWPARNKVMFGEFLYPLNFSGIRPGIVEDSKSGPLTRIARVASLPWNLQFDGAWGFDGQNDTPLGFFFLLFLPACFWWRRSDLTEGKVACLFFAVCYLLEWGFTVPVLRYATAPIAILALGLSGGLARALRVAPERMRVLLLAMVVYCHVYNWSVIASLGVRMPRLQLLAGKIDADRFLRLMMPSYASAAWIRDHAHLGERTLAVGNYALAYMGDPGLVHSILDEEGPFPVSSIRSELATGRYRYLLLPREVSPDQVFAGLIPAAALESADGRYLVFRLE